MRKISIIQINSFGTFRNNREICGRNNNGIENNAKVIKFKKK